MFRAIRDHDGSNTEKCISLTTGDLLSAVHAVDESWFIGHNDRSGETGAFPISCVTDISEDGNDVTSPVTPEVAPYANVSVKDGKMKESIDFDLDPIERSRTLSMKANTFDNKRLLKLKPEKTFRLKFVKGSDEVQTERDTDGTGSGESSDEDRKGTGKVSKLRSEGHQEVFQVKPSSNAVQGHDVEAGGQSGDVPLEGEATPTGDGQPKVRFSNENFMHSVSMADSWVDSSFEMSDRFHGQENDTASTAYSKNADKYHKLDKKQNAQEIKRSMRKIGEDLFLTDSKENKIMKSVFGALAGLVIGGLLFLVLVFSFGYSYLESGIIVTIASIIMSLCLAFSSVCRCIMALVFPNFFTGKGRTVFLSVIFGVLLTHPIANITHNAQETGRSLACMTELAANQSRAIQQQLAVPIEEITEYIINQKQKLEDLSGGISSKLEPIRQGLDSVNEGIQEANTFLTSVVKNCDQIVPPLQKYKETCDSIAFLSSLCKPAYETLLSIAVQCEKLDDVATSTLQLAANDTLNALTEAVEYFGVDIQAHADISGDSNISKPIDKIEEEVTKDISGKAEVFVVIMQILKKGLSLSLALVFFQSFWYLRNYLAKDGYDNVYITKRFKQLDAECERNGRPHVLPLKKRENGAYVDTAAVLLNTYELRYCKLGLAQVLLHFLVCLLVVLFDYTLFYILDIIQKYGAVDLVFGGQGHLTLTINGNGPVAEFYRTLIDGVALNQTFNASFKTSECLPKPSRPPTSTLPVLLILYLIALLFVLLRGYGMRLRGKISAYYYPEQETMRLDYLHKKIRHKRVGFLRFIRQQIMSSNKENAVKEKFRLSTWLAFTFPCLEGLLTKRSKVECTSCERTEHSFSDVRLSKCRGAQGGDKCDAVYCQECWEALRSVCPLCSGDDDVELRD